MCFNFGEIDIRDRVPLSTIGCGAVSLFPNVSLALKRLPKNETILRPNKYEPAFPKQGLVSSPVNSYTRWGERCTAASLAKRNQEISAASYYVERGHWRHYSCQAFSTHRCQDSRYRALAKIKNILRASKTPNTSPRKQTERVRGKAGHNPMVLIASLKS